MNIIVKVIMGKFFVKMVHLFTQKEKPMKAAKGAKTQKGKKINFKIEWVKLCK